MNQKTITKKGIKNMTKMAKEEFDELQKSGKTLSQWRVKPRPI